MRRLRGLTPSEVDGLVVILNRAALAPPTLLPRPALSRMTCGVALRVDPGRGEADLVEVEPCDTLGELCPPSGRTLFFLVARRLAAELSAAGRLGS